MTQILVWPILIPFATAAALLMCRHWSLRQFVSLAGAGMHLAACAWVLSTVVRNGISTLQIGNWPAPFGITLVADHLSGLLLIITGILGTATAVYAHKEMKPHSHAIGFHALFQVLLGGLSGAFLTGDLFNLYVWFEVMLMASFGLLVLDRTPAQFNAAVKYVVINLLATLLFLMGLALLYGMTGTLNMAHLHVAVGQHEAKGLLTAVAFIFMAAFGIKAGVFPLFFWLPAAYHTPPVAISAFFGGMLTKVGVYAIIRIFSLVFHHDIGTTHGVLLAIAAMTMVTGVLGAAVQNEFRRILSFHIISQVGYMILGLALWTPLALTGTIFYLVHHMIVKANLFLVSGLSRDCTGSMRLDRMGGIYRTQPLVAVIFFISAFSLAGFPPLSGFWSKLLLIQSGLEIERYLVVAIAVGVGLFTIYSMVKIWLSVFWKPAPQVERQPRQPSNWKMIPAGTLALITIFIGLGAEPVYQLASTAAGELLAPQTYVETVLKGGAP